LIRRAIVNARISPRHLGLALALSVPSLLAPSTCHADLVPITLGAPTISGSGGHLSYNASTGDFNETLSGPTLAYAAPFLKLTNGVPLPALFTGTLSIDLTVNQSGNFVSNGAGFTLTGKITMNLQDGGQVTFGTSSSSVLLTGTITAFGAQAAGPPTLTFDGTFTVTGGALTQTLTDTKGNPVFGGYTVGASGGFLLSVENVTGGTLGDFTHNFSSSSVKPTIGVLVPEPNSLVLLLTGAVALLGWRASRVRRRLSRGNAGVG
jgi:hypothetical protein